MPFENYTQCHFTKDTKHFQPVKAFGPYLNLFSLKWPPSLCLVYSVLSKYCSVHCVFCSNSYLSPLVSGSINKGKGNQVKNRHIDISPKKNRKKLADQRLNYKKGKQNS